MGRQIERIFFPADALPERVTYVASITPAFYGGYHGIFPDVPGTFTWRGTIKETREYLRRELGDVLLTYLAARRSVPKPSYRLRKDLKKVRQFRMTVDLSDLVRKR